MNETEKAFISRMDRDSIYRVTALQCATTRANLREHIGEDKEEVTSWADFFYNWLNGHHDGDGPPQVEKKKHEQ